MGKRQLCPACGRPIPVCLCSAFESVPAESRQLAGTVIVLQHPSESRRKLATVPLLKRALPQVHVLQSRRFKAGEHTALDAALEQAELEQTRLILLFPSPDALPINEVAADRATASQSQSHYTLLLLDSTWQFANEMFRALQERLLPPNGHATLAALSANVAAQTPDGAESVLSFVPADGVLAVAHGAAHELTKSASTIEGHPRSSKRSETSPLLLRTEPLAGGMTTMEATVRALAVLEGWDNVQTAATLSPLHALVQTQAEFNPSLRARLTEQSYVRPSRRTVPTKAQRKA